MRTGGYAAAFHRGPYLIDPAIHVMAQVGNRLPFDMLLRALGVADQVEFMPIEAMWGRGYPGLREHLPVGRQAFIEAHLRPFPGDADGLRRCWQICAR